MTDEVSFSIDETNRLRAELGLKPLATDQPESTEGGKHDDDEPILVDPVTRSRRTAADFDRDEFHQKRQKKDVLRLGHDPKHLEELLDGNEPVYLTLRDKSIIDGRTGHVDSSDDELEHPDLSHLDRKRREAADAQRDEFYATQDGRTVKKDILEHYDRWAASRVKDKGMVLSRAQEDETLSPEERLRRLLNQQTLGRNYHHSQTQVVGPEVFGAAAAPLTHNDFYTEVEMLKIRKRDQRRKPVAIPVKPLPVDTDDVEDLDVTVVTVKPRMRASEKVDEWEDKWGDELTRPGASGMSFGSSDFDPLEWKRVLSTRINRGRPITAQDVVCAVPPDLGLSHTIDESGTLSTFRPSFNQQVAQQGCVEMASTIEFSKRLVTPQDKAEAVRQKPLPAPPQMPGDGDGPVEQVVQEEYMGGGLAEALRKLKERGDLKPNKLHVRRGHDRVTPVGNTADSSIKLDYRDDYGRPLGPKEAFNYLSYKFHGRGPGMKKLERQKRRMKQQEKS
ncbi:MAG: hypothetical protein KVP17_003402 [Porospora cf. gigantea B]|uniref:uncharacterized protein n=1 Tax=Porospora cf. gigantea B TaxID=2853592 RepID=UPI0035717E6A|nr:MAG: hypothetical protein KVP17_003402 [Porospora cf. gigantea B]